jgi:hypothetical protein
MLAQQQAHVGGDLHGIWFSRHTVPFCITTGRAFLAINNLCPVRSAFHNVHHANETERFAFKAQAAEFCAFGQTKLLWIVQPGRRIYIPMHMRTGHGVRVLLKNVFNPLELKQARQLMKLCKLRAPILGWRCGSTENAPSDVPNAASGPASKFDSDDSKVNFEKNDIS